MDTVIRIAVEADAQKMLQAFKEADKWIDQIQDKAQDINFDPKDIKKAWDDIASYIEKKFSHLNLSQVMGKIANTTDVNTKAQQILDLANAMNTLNMAVKDNASAYKLGGASSKEVATLIREFNKYSEKNPDSRVLQKRLEALYEKYPQGNGLGWGSGSGGFSSEALDKIGNTLDRIDENVRNINESIQSGEIVVKALADGAEQTGKEIDKAAKAQEKLTGEIKETKKAQDDLNASEQKLSPVEKMKQKMGVSSKDQKQKSNKTETTSPKTKTITSVPDVTPAIEGEQQLKTVTQETNSVLQDQQTIINTLTTNGVDTAVASQQQLGDAVEGTTKKIEDQKKVLQETATVSTKEYSFKEIAERTGDIDNVQKYIYTIEEAESKLKEIKKKYRGKKEEEAQLSPDDVKLVWSALNSLDQFSLIGTEEEADRINAILDQYEEWVNLYLSQDIFGGVLSKLEAFFERIGEYQNALTNTNSLEQSRELYNLDIKQKSDIMTPDQTIEGYTYAIERVQIILETMDQYKAAIEEAQSKGQEITEADQKFLNDYEKTKNQWERASGRASKGLGQLQEQKRLAEEDRQRIEQEKQDAKERRLLKKQREREDRQTRIKSDKQFETTFQDYKIEDIENMSLEEIEQRIAQMEEYQNKAIGLKNELKELEQKVRSNASYKEEKLEEDELALMAPTEQETQWLEQYKNQAEKRKQYVQALKKQKVKINKENEAKAKAEAEAAKKNADEAQANAEKATEAAEQAEEAVDRTKQAAQETPTVVEGTTTESEVAKTITESAESAKVEAETVNKKTIEVEKSTKTLTTALAKHTQQLQEKRAKEEALIQEIDNLKTNGIDFSTPQGQQLQQQLVEAGVSIEEYTASTITSKESALTQLQTAIKAQEDKINQINESLARNKELEEQGYELIAKLRSKKTKTTKTTGGDIKETAEKNTKELEEANKKLEEEKKEADKIIKTGEGIQQTLDQASSGQTKTSTAKLRANKTLPSYTPIGDKTKKTETPVTPENKETPANNQSLVGISLNITSTKSLKQATEALRKLDNINKSIPKTADEAASALSRESEALDKLVEGLSKIGSVGDNIKTANETIESTVKDISTAPEEKVVSEATSSKTKPVLKSTKKDVKEIDMSIKKAEDDILYFQSKLDETNAMIESFDMSSDRFDVGTNKNKAYSQVKQFAEQLKKDYAELEAVDKKADPEKAQELADKYVKSQIAFSKAYQTAIRVGTPEKDKIKEKMSEYEKLYEQHGAVSENFSKAEERFNTLKEGTNFSQLEQVKTQLSKVIESAKIESQKLQAEKEEILKHIESEKSGAETTTVANNTVNAINNESKSATEAASEFDKLVEAKQRFTEANQQAAKSAEVTQTAINGEKEATQIGQESFDPKPLEDRIDVQEKLITAQGKYIDNLRKQAIEEKAILKELQQARKDQSDADQKELDAHRKKDAADLQRYKEAELQAQMMTQLQRQQFEEEERIRKEQEEKAAKDAEKRKLQKEQEAQTKKDDNALALEYSRYGKDFKDVLNAKSVQEFDVAVAHLTETEKRFWETRLTSAGTYADNSDMYHQTSLPQDFDKSSNAQIEGLKARENAIASFTATIIAELEKQQAAFDKMDTVYKTASDKPAHYRKDFIDNSLIDRNQTQKYAYAVDDVTASLQRFREITESMKNGTFDFGSIDALRELLELRQTLTAQMVVAKEADAGYKGAISEKEGDAKEKAEQFTTVLSAIAKQIEGIQEKSKGLINPDPEYKSELKASELLLKLIEETIQDINNNPLQFLDISSVSDMQAMVDVFKEVPKDFQQDYDSQQGIQGRIQTYLTSYKGAYTNLFREIKDSFKSQALGQLQAEVDQTINTLQDAIYNLNRATGLDYDEILYKHLNANGGKATAGQIEQQQKVRNALQEGYRGFITDMQDEINKMTAKLGSTLGDEGLKNFAVGENTQQFESFKNNVELAKDSLEELQNIQDKMAKGELDLLKLDDKQLKSTVQEIVKLFSDLNIAYTDIQKNAKELRLVDPKEIEKTKAQITNFIKSNPGISNEARTALNDYFNQLQIGINQTDFDKLSNGWQQVAASEEAAGRTGTTFFSELQTRFKSLGAYLLTFVSFYRVIGVFKDGISIIRELDDALVEMNKVSNESLASLQQYQKETFDTADKIGTTASQLQQSTADFLRLGESFAQAKESAVAANTLLTISEFENISDATSALTAISAAYEDTVNGLTKMDIVSKLNEVGDNYAISTDGLASALQDSASALTTAGELIARFYRNIKCRIYLIAGKSLETNNYNAKMKYA